MSTPKTTITSRIIKTQDIEWRKLEFIQDEDFKEWINDGDQKLLQSIVKYQFIDPFKVWENDGKLYCLDGKHRFLDLYKVTDTGVQVPEYLPATFINCADINEAAELVLVYSSAYARITEQGLSGYLQKFDLDLKDLNDVINLTDFSMEKFEQRFDQFDINEGEPVAVDERDVIVSLGDLFEINGHRIICGDSTDHKTLDDLLNGQKVSLLFTSPPYNMNAGLYAEYSDNMDSEEYLKLHDGVITNFLRHLSGFLFYNISYNRNSRSEFIDILHYLKNIKGCTFLELIVWNKKTALPVVSDEMLTRCFEQIPVISTDDMQADMEIFYLGVHQRKVYFNKRTGRTMSNYWEIPVTGAKVQFDDHRACFPIELPARAIQLTTKKGEIVADSFLGMGTTLIAADELERICYGIELKPSYVQSTILRYLQYCQNKSIDVTFTHVNGDLTLNAFIDAAQRNRKTSSHATNG